MVRCGVAKFALIVDVIVLVISVISVFRPYAPGEDLVIFLPLMILSSANIFTILVLRGRLSQRFIIPWWSIPILNVFNAILYVGVFWLVVDATKETNNILAGIIVLFTYGLVPTLNLATFAKLRPEFLKNVIPYKLAWFVGSFSIVTVFLTHFAERIVSLFAESSSSELSGYRLADHLVFLEKVSGWISFVAILITGFFWFKFLLSYLRNVRAQNPMAIRKQ